MQKIRLTRVDCKRSTDFYHVQYTSVPLTRAGKDTKLFHGLEAFDHGSVLMPNTIETKIEEILESIGPALKADDRDVEFLHFNEEGGVVELRLLGACEDCPISLMTLKGGGRTAPQEWYPGHYGGSGG